MTENILKPARNVAGGELQLKTPSGKPAGMPIPFDVEPKRKEKAKRRERKHYATLMQMNCKDNAGVIRDQYCPETKKFSRNYWRKFGDREVNGYALYDDGDRWDLAALLLSMYPLSIRKGIMTFLLYFKPLESESKHIINRLEEMQLLIHEAEEAHFKRLQKKRKRFRDYPSPP